MKTPQVVRDFDLLYGREWRVYLAIFGISVITGAILAVFY